MESGVLVRVNDAIVPFISDAVGHESHSNTAKIKKFLLGA